MRKVVTLSLLLLVVGWSWYSDSLPGPSGSAAPASHGTIGQETDWRSGEQVRLEAQVVRVLRDDNEGSRHQRFIISTDGKRTVLVAHNIDLAPRVPDLRVGDDIRVYGQFENNDRGGVIHWTHHDPAGRHVDGWIEHAGVRYR